MAPPRKTIHPLSYYELGSLILAKHDKFPYWPAEVRKCHNKTYYPAWKRPGLGLLWCHFIGDDCGAWVHYTFVKPFDPASALRWRSRKGPYVKTQPKAIDTAIEIYKRRLERGDDEPKTPPPEPEVVSENEEDEVQKKEEEKNNDEDENENDESVSDGDSGRIAGSNSVAVYGEISMQTSVDEAKNAKKSISNGIATSDHDIQEQYEDEDVVVGVMEQNSEHGGNNSIAGIDAVGGGVLGVGSKIHRNEQAVASENNRTRSGRVSKPSVRRLHPGSTRKTPQLGVGGLNNFRHKKQMIAEYRPAKSTKPENTKDVQTTVGRISVNNGYVNGGDSSDTGSGGGVSGAGVTMRGVPSQPVRNVQHAAVRDSDSGDGDAVDEVGRILMNLQEGIQIVKKGLIISEPNIGHVKNVVASVTLGIRSLRTMLGKSSSEDTSSVAEELLCTIKEVGRVLREEKPNLSEVRTLFALFQGGVVELRNTLNATN